LSETARVKVPEVKEKNDYAGRTMTSRMQYKEKDEDGVKALKDFFLKQRSIIEELTDLKMEVQILSDSNYTFKKNQNKPASVDSSSISYASTDSFKNIKVNLVERFSAKFHELLKQYEKTNNLILFVDNNGTIWEILRRKDLNANQLTDPENITSIAKKCIEDENKTFNIEVKNYDNASLNDSEIEISDNYFHINEMMMDTQHEDTDF